MPKAVPDEVLIAAKRGFIRSTAQAYSTALAAGISGAALLAFVAGEVEPVPTLITAGITLVSPLLTGASSYLSILSRGVPADYVDVAHARDPHQEHHSIIPAENGMIVPDPEAELDRVEVVYDTETTEVEDEEPGRYGVRE